MIELRWLEVSIPIGDGVAHIRTVLQYRVVKTETRRLTVGETYYGQLAGFRLDADDAIQWTDWQDVPIVSPSTESN